MLALKSLSFVSSSLVLWLVGLGGGWLVGWLVSWLVGWLIWEGG